MKTTLLVDLSQNVNVLKEGWLQKQSKYLQKYRKRWIVFQQNGWLYSYKREKEYKHHTEGVNLKALNNNDCVKGATKDKREFVINIDSSVYRFIAKSENDRNKWILTINEWISFHEHIMIYSKKWQQIIYDRTLKKMEFESSLSCDIQNCISLHECSCANRIVFILKFYHIWCSKQMKMQWSQISLESILKHDFGAYNINQVINDLIHLMKCHFRKNKTLSMMFFMDKLSKCYVNKLKCCNYLRNNRDRRKTNKKCHEIYFGSNSNTIVIMQVLDAFHCFILHSKEEEKENEKEEEKYDNDKIISFLNRNQNEKNRRINNKFTTHINCNCNVFDNEHDNDSIRNLFLLSPKFSSLKEELLQNKIYSLTPHEWDVVTQKAMKYKLSLFGASLNANNINIWNKRTKIDARDPISLSHVLCLLLNTNYCELSCLIKKQMIKNNKQFVHFYRLLFESVYLFGDVMNNNEYYYHNISSFALFDSFKVNFKAPVSSTTNLRFIKKKDCKTLTLKLHAINNKIMPFFDVSYFTDYIQENEMLLFRISLNIAHIYYDNMNNNLFMLSFKLFISMSDGRFFSYNQDLMSISTQKSLIKMLSNLNEYKNDKHYLQKLFNHYLENRKEEFWINDNEIEKLDKTLSSLYFSYLYCKNKSHLIIKKVQLFSWHIDIESNINTNSSLTLNGPTLLYTLNSFQIAFDSLMIINPDCSMLYFGVSSIPNDVKCVIVSFCLCCEEQKFYAQINDNKMSLYHNEDVAVRRVGCSFNNYNNTFIKLMTCKIAVKVTNIVYN